MRLSELKNGDSAIIVKIECDEDGTLRRRLTEMGLVAGKKITAIKNAPLKDPIEYEIMGYDLSLRRSEASLISITQDDKIVSRFKGAETIESDVSASAKPAKEEVDGKKEITVALIGNPNSGKTSLFNYISGLNEHVGNYSGVTVGSKEATVEFREYSIKIVDLPGTYSLSTYSPEEKYSLDYIKYNHPDVILNVIDGSNLERNLYLTTQLIDLEVDTVVSLNMYDELQKSGARFNHKAMSQMLGCEFIPTVARKGRGIPHILQAIVDKFEKKEEERRSIHINYGTIIEKWISRISEKLQEIDPNSYCDRYVAIKMIEGCHQLVEKYENSDLDKMVAKAQNQIEKEYSSICETIFADARYGFIHGALKETYKNGVNRKKQSDEIDKIVTNKYLGLPIFMFVIWFMFYCTFTIGAYPMDGLDWLVSKFQELLSSAMQNGALKDLVVDGIIGGVGSVIIFLPNILLLFLFISFLEDSGYMARAAFLMDKLMHKIGLHGKSFIPLVMGFGCNVPAVMATRIIEDKNNRILTMLLVPFMSCSARLPVYILILSAFFPENASTMLFLIYGAGIIMAVVTSIIFKKIIFTKKDLPFVMELPPYRIPTTRSIIKHMWDKSGQYLKKMGGVILIAVVIIWALGYFPLKERTAEQFAPQITEAKALYQTKVESGTDGIAAKITLDSTLLVINKEIDYQHSTNSYIAKIGHAVEPVFRPLGFDWKLSVGLITGLAAKEVVVSTLGVLHNVDEDDYESGGLKTRLREDRKHDGTLAYNRAVGASFLIFVLLYFPCIAVVMAIRKEGGSIWWAVLNVVYSTTLAWICSFVTYSLMML